MKVLDLCSGIGGIALATTRAGMETVAFCEIDPFCSAVLAQHWPNIPNLGDIHHVTEETIREAGVNPTTIDIVCSGFPCQPSSTAGKRRGSADPRNLWPDVSKVIRKIHPRWVVLENVPGLLSVETGRLFGQLLWNLAQNRYDAGWQVYSAANVGAPHLRERIFIVAHAESDHERGLRSGGTPLGEMAELWAGNSRAHVADSARQLCERTSDTRPGRPGLADGSNAVADATGKRPQGQVGAESSVFSNAARYSNAGVGVADANGAGLSLWDGLPGTGPHAPIAGSGARQVESGICRGADGLSSWLDGHRWPARPGEAQEAWEPPRVVTERIPNRAARLKALGNAVVPQQILPIFQAIMAIEREEAS